MTTIETPQGPGVFISRWRTEGPVASDVLEQWKDELQWPSWLSLAEAALFMDAPELLETMSCHLSKGEHAVLGLVRRRWLGDTHLDEAIEAALGIVRSPETRDLALEGRLRMERGLARFEAGDTEGAEEDLTWAETRLKSVAKASRDHDLSLLNKAAYHMAQGEALMALQVYGDISRKAGHAHETIAISRLGASRIRQALGHLFDAGRHAWNAHKHAMLASQTQMAIEAGSLFLDLSIGHQSDTAEPMHVQVENARPLDLEDEPPVLMVHPDDINGVFEWCCEHLQPGWGGSERPDVRAMLTLAHRLDRMERFSSLMVQPETVEDPMLAAVAQACASTPDETDAWGQRLSELTMP
ncbi:MAG: hypothetical protein DWC03_03420 [Candidatus Poseidoniales archaeon]|nr:MAG: hypothetical protein DWC03_03420 [Candidatus Poseidoniales archaeon]